MIPEGVEIIGEKAFYFCTGLKTVTFPKSLREIRVEEAFSNCRSLKEIVIPDGVSVMEPEAFSWCEGLERVRLPESLAWLEKRGIFKLQQPEGGMDSVGVKMIGQEAFWEAPVFAGSGCPNGRSGFFLPPLTNADSCPGSSFGSCRKQQELSAARLRRKREILLWRIFLLCGKTAGSSRIRRRFWLGEQRYAGTEELLFNKDENAGTGDGAQEGIFMEDGF